MSQPIDKHPGGFKQGLEEMAALRMAKRAFGFSGDAKPTIII